MSWGAVPFETEHEPVPYPAWKVKRHPPKEKDPIACSRCALDVTWDAHAFLNSHVYCIPCLSAAWDEQ